MSQNYTTWATLKPDTPFNAVFPNGEVPVLSPLPMIPREAGSPPCFVVNAGQLDPNQVDRLADLLLHQWHPECANKEQAIAYIQRGLPLKCDWFSE